MTTYSVPTTAGTSGVARLAFGVLLVLSVLGAVNHFALMFYEDNTLAFAAFAATNAASVVLVWFGYRAKELWAWWAVWFEVLALAAVAVAGDPTSPNTDSGLQIAYGVIAGVMALAQLGSLSSFRK